MEEKFELDVWYVENQNLLVDLEILFLTLRKVVKKKNISAHNEATMPRFTGSLNDKENMNALKF